ncbi:hypothetical protein L1987_33583 [Smallanthus sonchifolius]|uniref:Uncharacterized protein n=1 Tax=Smallanthus sonchifolius TaxID=185202 RepID=A0ACB9HU10_9ASTR|nr:hypothetical protein L1987_33583 [Smallanthus sonchifolius]
MSGIRKLRSKFALDDINSMVSKGKNIKREPSQTATTTPKPETSKPESLTAHPKPTSNKKRKIADPVEVAINECSDYADVHKKLHALSHLVMDKIARLYELSVKEAEESKQMIRIRAANNKKLADTTDDLNRVKAELQDAYAQHAKDLEESHEQVKMSAAVSIFQVKIKMAEEAADKDFDRANWDVLRWKKLVAELSGEPMQKEGEGKLVVEGEAEGLVKAVAEVFGQDNEGKEEKDLAFGICGF